MKSRLTLQNGRSKNLGVLNQALTAACSLVVLLAFTLQAMAAPSSTNNAACGKCVQERCNDAEKSAKKSETGPSLNEQSTEHQSPVEDSHRPCTCHLVSPATSILTSLEIVFCASVHSGVPLLTEQPNDPLVRLIYLPPRLS
jgi:hypothetical protein